MIEFQPVLIRWASLGSAWCYGLSIRNNVGIRRACVARLPSMSLSIVSVFAAFQVSEFIFDASGSCVGLHPVFVRSMFFFLRIWLSELSITQL